MFPWSEPHIYLKVPFGSLRHCMYLSLVFISALSSPLHSEHFESTVWHLILLLFYKLFPFIKNFSTICLIFLTLIYFQLTCSNTSTLTVLRYLSMSPTSQWSQHLFTIPHFYVLTSPLTHLNSKVQYYNHSPDMPSSFLSPLVLLFASRNPYPGQSNFPP